MEISSIKILGRDGCPNCARMFQYVQDIAAEKNLQCQTEHVTDFKQVLQFGVMSLPGLVINEKVVSYGKILSKAEIQKYIEG